MAGKRKGKRSGLRKFIRSAYKILGAANTASYVLGGDPVKLAKHAARRKGIKTISGLLK